MAIPAVVLLLNDTNDTSGSPTVKGNSRSPRSKPSRCVILIRNRCSPSKLCLFMGGLILILLLSAHRGMKLRASSQQLMHTPYTFLERTCPKPPYEQLVQTSTESSSSSSSSSSSLSNNNNKNGNEQQQQQQPPKKVVRACITTLTDHQSTNSWQRFMRWRNYDGILELILKNRQDYAKRHGYRFFDTSNLLDTSRPPGWSKIPAVQHLLRLKGDEACDWVIWMDADVVIMNDDIRVEQFLPADATHDLLITKDHSGYNSGVWLLRNTDWSRGFLDQWWNMTHHVHPPGLSLSGDNHAFDDVLLNRLSSDEFSKKVLVPPRCTFNSFPQFTELPKKLKQMEDDPASFPNVYMSDGSYHKGDFIAHAPGYSNKKACVQKLLEVANHERTSYKQQE